ncbi:MAG: DUF938 domain-containing protein [Azospirillaceae bacterium]
MPGAFMTGGDGEPGVVHGADAKRHAPATERNREPILAELKRLLPDPATVLEIGSGTGEHACHFAAGLPHVVWQPSDADPELRASTAAWAQDAALSNLLAPIALDVTDAPWPVEEPDGPVFDVVFSANMIHIAPWACTTGLMRGAAAVLKPRGYVILYGPFMRGGVHTSPSNDAFDSKLRAQNVAWGIRDLDRVGDVAAGHGMTRQEVAEMPANNLLVVFRTADR